MSETNESFAQVPLDLTKEDPLRRILQKIVEEVDLILGNRADDPYVAESELAGERVSLTSLSESITSLNETLSALDSRVEDTELENEEQQAIIDDVQYTVTHRTLDTAYNDFDDASWGTLKGRGQFTALGSAMTNPPYAVTAGTTYIVYAESALTLGGGVVQTVYIEDTGTGLRIFVRTGDSFAQAVTNGWKEI